ncbi:MAG: hypothetical protein IRZ33_09365 [Alicyclobacillaceae bacterium]|nr:hypothetical protein [Alicyclobacillaceae bacterium]
MRNTAYVLACDADRTFTALNRFDPKTSTFEGEYSLLHNTYSNDGFFLYRFLIAHRDHPLVFLDSGSERYYHVIHTYHHFQEDDIPKYIEEKVQQQQEQQHDLMAKRSVGQIQLLIAKKMIEKEWESVKNEVSRSERDTYILLGKDWAFGWSVRTINEIVERGNH